MQRLTFLILALLLTLLPFHAFLYTWLHSIFWTDSWMVIVQAWKEILVALIALFSFARLAVDVRIDGMNTVIKKLRRPLLLTTIAYLILAGLYLLIGPGELTQKIFGLRTIALPWVALLAVSLFDFSEQQKKWLTYITLGAATLVVSFALVQKFFLPADFLAHFGYSRVVSTWLPGGNLPMYHLVGGTDIIRAQSTFAGPNQLGAYLLVIVPVIVGELMRTVRQASYSKFQFSIFNGSTNSPQVFQRISKAQFLKMSWLSGCLATSCLAVFLTYSRAAWLGLLAMAGVAVLAYAYHRTAWRGAIALVSIGMLTASSLGIIALTQPEIHQTLLRSASTSEHISRTTEAAKIAIAHPFGLGLGATAGGSQRFDGSSATEHLTPENTFVGITLELGWIGGLLFITLLITLGCALVSARSSLAYSLLGLAVVMLVLHPLEDAPTALTFALLAGASTPSWRL